MVIESIFGPADDSKNRCGFQGVSPRELAERREYEGDPSGTLLCYGCGYKLGPDRVQCPKCHGLVHGRTEEPTGLIGKGRAATDTEKLLKRLAVKPGDSPAVIAGKQSGFLPGSSGYRLAYEDKRRAERRAFKKHVAQSKASRS